jgi:ABC-type glycerol-3-phosphate transport system substrate-binding protein
VPVPGRPPRLSRRAVLQGAAGTALTTVLAGCGGGSSPRVQVAVVWSGGELARFREVLRAYPGRVDVTSAGDDIDAFLRARRRAGNSPDVAVVSRPGLVRGYVERGWLAPVHPELAGRYPTAWNELLTFGGRQYGVWLKAAHKSLFWYLPAVLPSARVPATWDELHDLVHDQARAPRAPAPLAVGAGDGWVLTDWLENLLAALVPAERYAALARGESLWDTPEVRPAFAKLGELWSEPGAFPGGGRRALLTQYDEAVLQVVATHEAMTTFEGDFVAGVADRFVDADTPVDRRPRTFPFPSPDQAHPLLVGGDAAVVLDDSPGGHRLVEWLTRPGSFAPWIAAGGYLSPNREVAISSYPAGLARRFAQDLVDASTDGLRFDLSDLLPGELTGADGQGSWKILQDFFADVTRADPDVPAAVRRAVTRLDDGARQARAQDDDEAAS